MSGHDIEAFARVVGDMDVTGVTLVVLMGRERSAQLGQVLLDRGWAGSTPAALVFDASGASQDVWRGSIGELVTASLSNSTGRPATIVIGEVVDIGVGAVVDELRDTPRKRRG
jgi:siroheme synthase